MDNYLLTVKLADLGPEERALVERLLARAKSRPRWDDFENFWVDEVFKFYGKLPSGELQKTAGYQVGNDLAARLVIAAGMARIPDYRDELAEIIRRNFPTRRKFCEQTGLSETMLSQVLGGTKHLSIDALIEALAKIGYQLRLVPSENIVPDNPAPDDFGLTLRGIVGTVQVDVTRDHGLVQITAPCSEYADAPREFAAVIATINRSIRENKSFLDSKGKPTPAQEMVVEDLIYEVGRIIEEQMQGWIRVERTPTVRLD